MKKYKMRHMTTVQLDKLLQAELRKDTPDEGVVLPILEILEEREQKPRKKHNWIVSIAAVAAVLVLLIAAVPQAVGADSFWEVMIHLSDSILQFFAPGKEPKPAESEYIFQTDNPGLQQLYDKVVELGITDPIVPTWLPKGYALKELKTIVGNDSQKLTAVYMQDGSEVVIEFRFFDHEIPAAQYEMQHGRSEMYESGRISHAITQNDNKWMAIWVRSGVECLVAVDLSKEDLCQIIASIYRRK